MTAAARKALSDALATVKPAQRGKYGNRKTVVDGITFDSAREAKRWGELRSLERRRLIRDLRRQVPYRLEVNGVLICTYKSDFDYVDSITRQPITEDAKGFRTPEYRLKAKLMLACHGISVREV